MDNEDYIVGNITFGKAEMKGGAGSGGVDLAAFKIEDDSLKVEKDLLLILAEEGAEVTQAASKILRFGRDSKGRKEDGRTNWESLEQEIADVLMVAELLGIDINSLDEQKQIKLEKLKKYGVIENE